MRAPPLIPSGRRVTCSEGVFTRLTSWVVGAKPSGTLRFGSVDDMVVMVVSGNGRVEENCNSSDVVLYYVIDGNISYAKPAGRYIYTT